MNLENSKTINKPWGKEVWLELNEKYCYKRIYINAGHRTSFQYHINKRETNFIIEGVAEVWLENDNGVVEKIIMKAGDFFNVTPPKKHRVIAITDIILQEVSTPEVDDVIRIEDDTNRINGRLEHEHMPLAMCIVAAGKGMRLGKLVEGYHKALLPVDNKAIISHIINKTSLETDIIIAIGYNGNLIKEYCEAAHPERKISFVEVGDYTSERSGPGYSLLQCKKLLQRPFYFTTADCLIKEELPLLDNNWLGLSKTSIPELYSTVDLDNKNLIKKIKNKDAKGYENAFIGLCGIFDFNTFWDNLENNIKNGEMISAFYDISNFDKVEGKFLTWYDIGTVENYLRALKEIPNKKQYGIQKENGDYVYRVGDVFIKYCKEINITNSIKERSLNLKGLTPDINYCGENFFSYNWVEGNTLYHYNNEEIYKKFLGWSQDNLWSVLESINQNAEFLKFYKDKTLLRIEKFLEKRDSNYKNKLTINGQKCNDVYSTINKINFESLSTGLPTKQFHGDLQFDNIIFNEKNDKFTLIDWRPNFGYKNDIGDVYYDLAKLYGGMIISYQDMKDDNNITLLKKSDDVINFSYIENDNLKKVKLHFEKWVNTSIYDLNKINTLTSLIFLNMASLHSDKFGDMLYFLALYRLNSYENK